MGIESAHAKRYVNSNSFLGCCQPRRQREEELAVSMTIDNFVNVGYRRLLRTNPELEQNFA